MHGRARVPPSAILACFIDSEERSYQICLFEILKEFVSITDTIAPNPVIQTEAETEIIKDLLDNHLAIAGLASLLRVSSLCRFRFFI